MNFAAMRLEPVRKILDRRYRKIERGITMLLGSAKLSNVTVDNVEKPKVGRIVSITKSPKYTESGDSIQGTVSKVNCQFVDSSLARVVEKAGSDPSELKTYTLELVGAEADLLSLSESEMIGSEIQLSDAKVMLRWVTGRNGGGWRELKLVMNVSNESPKETEK